MDWFRRSVDSFQTAWSGFPVSYRVLSGFLLVLLALVGVWGVTMGTRDGWVLIVDGRESFSDRALIQSKLREVSIPTKVDGDRISVPSAKADEAMLHLHSSNVLGDEAFFKFLKETSLFSTKEQTDRQWLVAQQGRLASMIQGLNYVRSAKVQISEPTDPKRLWWSDGQEATAAVVLEMRPNEEMTGSRIRGIATLVAAAVPGLKASNVRMLEKNGSFFQVPDRELEQGGSIRDLERALAADIEKKALWLLPTASRVAAQVRLSTENRQFEKKTIDQGATESSRKVRVVEDGGQAGKKDTTEEQSSHATGHTLEHLKSTAGSDYKSISLTALIPDTAPGVPADGEARAEYVRQRKTALRTATGAKEEDISILVGPLTIADVTGASGAPTPVTPESWIQAQGPMILLVLLGFAALIATYRLVRGMAPVADGGVVAEESLRAPGESILSAQDEVLDRIRDGVRESVTRNPREAADVARRWMAP